MLDLRVLGGFRVVRDGGEVSELAAQPTRAALLVLLALEGTTTRDSVLALLWPEHDAQKARHALSQTLHRLRGALGEEWIESEGERLSVSSAVHVDAREFASLVEQGEHEGALALYQGPFLSGWFLADCPAFERWSDQQRARMERLHRLARREAIRLRRARGDLDAALRIAQEWADIDPLEDEAHHRLIEMLAESGCRADALAQFELHRQLLEDEGLEPLDETVQLVARLRQANDIGPLADPDRSPDPAGADVAPAGPSEPASGDPDSAETMRTASSGPRATLADRTGKAARPARYRRERRVGLAVVMLAVLTGAVLAGRTLTPDAHARRAALPPGGRLLLADFTNGTRDTLVAGVVTEALRIDLKRYLHSGLADPAETSRILGQMQQSPLTMLTGETAREVALRAGIPAVIDGRVGAVGPGFVLSAWVVAAESGRILDATLATARDSAELLDAIEALSRQLRSTIRPSLADLPQATRLSQVTTSSLEALRRYTLAVRTWQREGDGNRAVLLLEQATRLDTMFAMADRARAVVLMNIGGERRLWRQALERAYRHRDHLSDRERYITVANYHQSVTGEADQAMSAYLSVLQLDPADVTANNNLGLMYREMREFSRAEPLLRRCLASDSLVLTCAINLCGVVHALGRKAEADTIARRAVERFPRNPFAFAQLAWLAAANFDYADADSLFGELASFDLPNPGALEVWLGYLDMVRGRIREARTHLERAYRTAGSRIPVTAAAARRSEAWMELEILHDTTRALALMRSELHDSIVADLGPADVPYVGLADFYASAGRLDLANAQLDAFATRLPLELRRPAQGGAYAVRGLIAMKQGHIEEARQAFRNADRYVGSPFRVLQYLGPLEELAGRPDSAIAAYERYLSTGTLDRLAYDAVLLPGVLERLAYLYRVTGHPDKAARYEMRFAELWAEADPDLQPRVEAARRRAGQVSASRTSG